MDNFESVEQTMKERSDDAAELRRQRKRESLPDKISRFLDGPPMSANEADVLTRDYAPQIDAERARREQAAAKEKAQAEEHAAALWQDRYTRDDADAADRAIHDFCQRHPNFKRSIPRNGELLVSELRRNNELVTLETLERAYQTLRPMGVFVEKTEEERRVDRLSADQYRQEHPELADHRVPPVILKQAEKALLTFISTHPQYIPCEGNRALMMEWLSEVGLPPTTGNLDSAFTALQSQGLLKVNSAVVTSGATKLTDFGDTGPRGVPPQSSKYSFRKKIESMSASEYAERCANDPQFKEALDNLE